MIRDISQNNLEFLVESSMLDPSNYYMKPDGALLRFREEMNRNFTQLAVDLNLKGLQRLEGGDTWWRVRSKLNSNFAVASEGGGLPPGNPLLFVDPDGVDSIGLSADIIDQLSTEQQTYFNANPSWDSYALFWADVSVQSWFNDENIIGTETGGVWIGAAATSRYNLNKVLVWFGLPPILVYAFGPDEEIMIGPDETQVEAI